MKASRREVPSEAPLVARRSRGARSASAALLILGAACSNGGADPSELAFGITEPFAVRDSGVVLIAESGRPLWSEGEVWTIDPEPRFVIGTIEGSDAYLLQSVQSAHLLPDGGVIFGEAGDGTVRRFDREGEWMWSVGGEGEGPGEFQCLSGIHLQGESVLAWQCSPTGAGAHFSLDGEVLAIEPVRSGARGRVVSAFSNGDLLMHGWDGPSVKIDDRLFLESRPFVRAKGDRSADTILVLPYVQEMAIPVVGETGTQILSPRNVSQLHRDSLYAGFNKRYQVEVFDSDGELVRVVRRAFEPDPVDRRGIRRLIHDALDEELEEIEDAMQRRALRFLVRGVLRLLIWPDFMPTFSEIRVAETGELWVRTDTDQLIDIFEFEMPASRGHWDVFGHEGRWLGTVVTPAGFDIHEIGDDYVLGVVTNELDVQFVVAYSLEKPDRDPRSNEAGSGLAP